MNARYPTLPSALKNRLSGGACLSLLGLTALVVLAVSLSGCKPSVDFHPEFAGQKKPPQQVKTALLREDEKARLRLFAMKWTSLEKSGAFHTLYERYSSPSFRKIMSRTSFLKLGLCLENHLGPVVAYRKDPLEMTRTLDDHGNPTDRVRYDIRRTEGSVRESLYVVQTPSLDYRLQGIYWGSSEEGFKDCIKKVLAQPNPSK